MVNDLADPGSHLASLPMNELFATYRQSHPVAVVPAGDPMVLLNDGTQSIQKINAYRVGVNQIPVFSLQQADTAQYCRNMETVFSSRIANHIATRLLSAEPSPAPPSTNLYTFLISRFNTSIGPDELNCAALLSNDDD